MLSVHKVLPQVNFAPAEVRRNLWYTTIPANTPVEDLFTPEYFANVAQQCVVGDRIECYPEDGSYFLELIVTAVCERTETRSPNWLKVVKLRYIDLVSAEDKKLALPEGFFSQYRGGSRWCVLRKGEKENENVVIIEKQASRADAIHEFHKMKSKLT